MAFKDFFDEHKKIIIVILLVIVAFIIYRYFWEQKSVTNDFNVSNLENRINNLETSLGFSPLFNKNPNTPPIISGQASQKICLSQATQDKIADEIDKKLKEINACDCSETCSVLNKPK
jgi:hypothetical protein